jgi:hypothetical protein
MDSLGHHQSRSYDDNEGFVLMQCMSLPLRVDLTKVRAAFDRRCDPTRTSRVNANSLLPGS